MRTPETRYPRSGDLRIAYQKWGAGPALMIVPPLISNVELVWEHELIGRSLEYLGRHFTCVHFDKRGIGLSDRFDELPTLSQRLEDIRAVMSAVGWEKAHFFGISEGGAMGQLFAADFPEQVESLVLLNSIVPPRYRKRIPDYVRDGDPPLKPTKEIYERFLNLVETWSEQPACMVDWMTPSQSGNGSFVRWTGRLQRMTCSPRDFRRQVESIHTLDAGDARSGFQVEPWSCMSRETRFFRSVVVGFWRRSSPTPSTVKLRATITSPGSCRTGAIQLMQLSSSTQARL